MHTLYVTKPCLEGLELNLVFDCHRRLTSYFCVLYTVAFSDFAGRRVAIIVGGLLYGVGGILQTAAIFLWLVCCAA